MKPFNKLSRWQRNRCICQSINESAIFENYDFEEETSINIAISSKERIIEKYQVETPFIHSQSTDFSDILRYSSDSNDSNVKSNSNVNVQEEIDLIKNTLDNDKTTNTTNFIDHNKTFSSELQFWAITNKISNNALSKLLKLYKKHHPNEEILSDVRVFLNTPNVSLKHAIMENFFITVFKKLYFLNISDEIRQILSITL